MKRLLSLLSLMVLGFTLFPMSITSAYYSTYSGADNSNDYADAVVQNASGILTEKTTAASNSSSNDVTLYKNSGSEVVVGYSYPFDGISAEVYNSGTGGSYTVKYWDGSSWNSLESGSTISNSTDGTFQVEWDRPSSWAKNNVSLDTDEDGNSGQTTGYYYFVKLVVTSGYNSSPTFSQIGVLNYNLQINVNDEFGDNIDNYTSSYTFSASSADPKVYISKNDGNGTEYYGFYSPSSGASYSYTATVGGYVQKTGSITLDKDESTLNLGLEYSHQVYGRDASSGSTISLSSAYAGTDNTTCTIHNGVANCPVPVSEDGGTATVSASGYTTTTASIPNRTSESTAQQVTYVSMNKTGTSGNDDVDLTVNDLYFNNDAIWAEIANEGDEDVSSSDTVYVSVYVDGTREYYGTISYAYFDDNESNDFAFLSGDFDDNEYYEIEVCIDSTDTINEDDESNNCRTETLKMSGSSNDDGADLTVDDLYFSGDYLYAKVSNEGNEDVDKDHAISIAVYSDGDREYLSSYSYTYFEEGEENTISFLNDNVWDDDETYEIEVCIDYDNDVDEDDESDNCRTEDLKFGSSSSGGNEPDLDVTDIYLDSNDDLKFTVENRGDEDVNNGEEVTIKVYVDGHSQYSKYVTQSSSSTNFLDEGEEDTYNAGDILEDEGSTYEVEVCVDTDDEVDESNENNNCMTVDEDSIDTNNDDNDSCGDFRDLDGGWYEEYVCDLYERDVVSGRSDYYFYPNSTTTRAEFLKMVLLDAELDPYSVSSVHYSDVSSSSWYYPYVTYATAEGYVDGYSNGSFKPNQAITRAEALVILMRVADQNDFSFDENDIDFWDVNVHDWFAYAVVIADEDNLVDGYSNGSFGPNNSITRGEAAKILDLAYDEYFN